MIRLEVFFYAGFGNANADSNIKIAAPGAVLLHLSPRALLLDRFVVRLSADGVELVLEPMGFPPARTYQKALFDAGIPATAFITTNIQAEFQRLRGAGVKFRGEPRTIVPATVQSCFA